MTTFMNFNLTQYTDLRSLQFEYIKVKDENAQLKMKLQTIQKMYQNVSLEFSEYKKQQSKKGALIQSKINNKDLQLAKYDASIKQLWMNMNEITSNEESYHEDMSIEEVISSIEFMLKSFMENDFKTKEAIRKINLQNQKKQKQWTFREENLAQKIAELHQDLKNLEDMRIQLHAENTMLLKENQELTMQVASYKLLAQQARSKTPQKQKEKVQEGETMKDDAFAVDLLTYEKQYLNRVFLNLIERLRNEDLQVTSRKIYQIYEQITECYKEKLQLEYDLEDLEYQYKKQRNSGEQEMVMELRKEIQIFRKQLNQQKQNLCRLFDILDNLEEKIQEKFKQLQCQQLQQQKLRNMTVDMQQRLRKNNQVQFPNHQNYTKKLLQVRQTPNTDDLLNDMIEKDRQNLEKILQQTRSYFKK